MVETPREKRNIVILELSPFPHQKYSSQGKIKTIAHLSAMLNNRLDIFQ